MNAEIAKRPLGNIVLHAVDSQKEERKKEGEEKAPPGQTDLRQIEDVRHISGKKTTDGAHGVVRPNR